MPQQTSLHATLQFANEMRARLDLDPLSALCPGIQDDPARSPLAETIDHAHVDADFVELPGEAQPVMIPLAVARFLYQFNHGYHPNLILPDA